MSGMPNEPVPASSKSTAIQRADLRSKTNGHQGDSYENRAELREGEEP